MSRPSTPPGVQECDVCGRLVADARYKQHLQVCALRPYSTDGACPMCGDQYESYTSHLQTCEPQKNP